jgi:hypothetical protein
MIPPVPPTGVRVDRPFRFARQPRATAPGLLLGRVPGLP